MIPLTNYDSSEVAVRSLYFTQINIGQCPFCGVSKLVGQSHKRSNPWTPHLVKNDVGHTHQIWVKEQPPPKHLGPMEKERAQG